MADANNHITYSLADIQRYLQGGMSAKEMHDLERAALEDPFLADALEGFSETDMRQAQQHLMEIETAIRQQQKESKVIALPALKKYYRWQVAASVILLIGIVGFTYFIFNKKSNEVTLVKMASGSTKAATDSVQMREQTISPSTADTTTIAKKDRVGDEQSTSLLADNKRKNKKELSQPTSQAPAPMAAMKEGSDRAGLSASSAMAMQDSANQTARTSTDNQQPVQNELNTSKAGEAVVTGYGSLKKDSNKAGLSAGIARARQVPNNEIAGTIIDNHQQPVPNAKVILQDSTQAVTDRNGNFSIPTNDSSAVASITAFGYKPVDNQKLRKGRNNITLKEKPFSLADVEVTNLVTKGKRVADTAVVKPQGGWQSFQKYVYNKLNKKYDSTALSSNAYINGDLELEFSISEAGDPYDFKVLHAPDTQTANKAITAIKEGPRWISSDKSIKMRVTVRYK